MKDVSLANMAQRIRDRAVRRGGELLYPIEHLGGFVLGTSCLSHGLHGHLRFHERHLVRRALVFSRMLPKGGSIRAPTRVVSVGAVDWRRL